MQLLSRMSGKWFNFVHLNNLVYNTCWEDPRLDRAALRLTPDDTVMVITSAGCNALDYLLDSPRHVHAVDMNPRQNALLELKVAGIRALDYDTFFQMFGSGKLEDCRGIYQTRLRAALSPESRDYWDRHIKFFGGKGWRPTFYYRGTSGTFARFIKFYIDRVAKVAPAIEAILDADDVDEQRRIYNDELRAAFWKKPIKWMVGRDTTLSFLGVPREQRRQVERDYEGGIAGFIEDSIESVFSRLPMADNYFWRVYLTGEYLPHCCPEYLKPHNFARLRAGLVDRLSTHTTSVQHFLEGHEQPISRFVLLDHMDWLSTAGNHLLDQEWQAIVNRAAPGARLLWRSGGLRTEFVDRVTVRKDGALRHVGELLQYNLPLAEELHARDRVHTYGSFHIADLRRN
jgi:S-adenosylmethionine-diacylglycerol 3-amino-3-carboxypropyl transferase